MAKNSSTNLTIQSDVKIEKTSKKNKKAKIIDEEKEIAQVESKSMSKKVKRKSKSNDDIIADTSPPKKLKKGKSKKNSAEEETPKEEEEEDNENEQFDDTNDDVKKPKPPSKRLLKKQRFEQQELDKKEASRLDTMSKALEYVSIWKHSKNTWKFEKLKQIWLMENLLDENSVPKTLFPTVLEYFEGCKGMARETLLKKAMSVIKKHEKNVEESEDAEETVEYIRARELLQALPTET
ncbi:hypothetical protein HCN44_010396 [Aphidius gifuensis]|uniref:WKF domain-containing protein n=1 Tax=Aphidius gifuensis TaxID=684658 RepID=A0A834XZ18_APHGI|nr:uncharacterized protein C7orf50 homolog [Aphidius gifuensis]KAF7993789.1 hypothetical protein HCN44_010396 [Aphidius gifuensis]